MKKTASPLSLTSLPPGHYKKSEKCNNPEYSRDTHILVPSKLLIESQKCISHFCQQRQDVLPWSISTTFQHRSVPHQISFPQLESWRRRMFENHNQCFVLSWAMIRVPAKSQKSGVRIFSTSNANQKNAEVLPSCTCSLHRLEHSANCHFFCARETVVMLTILGCIDAWMLACCKLLTSFHCSPCWHAFRRVVWQNESGTTWPWKGNPWKSTAEPLKWCPSKGDLHFLRKQSEFKGHSKASSQTPSTGSNSNRLVRGVTM